MTSSFVQGSNCLFSQPPVWPRIFLWALTKPLPFAEKLLRIAQGVSELCIFTANGSLYQEHQKQFNHTGCKYAKEVNFLSKCVPWDILGGGRGGCLSAQGVAKPPAQTWSSVPLCSSPVILTPAHYKRTRCLFEKCLKRTIFSLFF